MRTPDIHEHCNGQCGSIVTERNRYYTGKLLVARDLVQEQAYFLDRHRLHNRLLHGWGVVCGLEVQPHPEEDCAKKGWLVVEPGIAIDCYGRELVLCEPTSVQLPQEELEYAAAGKPADDGTGDAEETGEAEETGDAEEGSAPAAGNNGAPPGELLVLLGYGETGREAMQVLYDECGCGPARVEANRIRETPRAAVRRLQIDKDCWPGLSTGQPHCEPCRSDAGTTSCLEPCCPCGTDVPIALISRADEEPGYSVDIEGRRRLPAPGIMTRIVDVSWSHGCRMELSCLEHEKGQLRIRFDRELERSRGDATGINRFTFVVQYESARRRNLEFVPSRPDPYLTPDGCSAVFTIPREFWSGDETIRNSLVYVTLKCDFVLDCNHHPVDGDFLRAQLPTGDGTWGGTFESWFRVP
jgi:hypothetical protein